ncbi:electron transport complex subunit RsxD [Thiohalomonas denitrificans]|uniref:electron transport complex subunit RsxD n=1 Tax=Thiohalomonas denitrificans TaxID=415747 RepID=UPI0026EB468F|nr:electron transport complex subunit RsxD [Thiohalomonas denitrificans]
MAEINSSSPYAHNPQNVTGVMLAVVYALIPATLAYVWLFGPGVLLNIGIAAVFALSAEATILAWRGAPVRPALSDGSALVTALLLGLALPPLSPWWLTTVGILFAIIIAKQLYGGLGFNPFNPAMVGYVALLISFPVEMTTWLAPESLRSGELGFGAMLSYVFTGNLPVGLTLDSITAATPLDEMKTQLSLGQTVNEIRSASPLFAQFGGTGWQVINGLFLLGGLWLLARRVITWHAPVGLLGMLFLLAGFFHFFDAGQYPGPVFHIASGGVLLGAFFIATDPTSGATSNKGRLVFGAGAGALIYLIRTFGGFPDAVAFSVLLMNMAAPTIDYYTQPRVYGHIRKD